MNDSYSVFVVPDETTDGSPCYLAYHPELDGCMSHGSTVGEAVQNLDDAREAYLNTLRELGHAIPSPSSTPQVVIWRNLAEVPLNAQNPSNVILPTARLTTQLLH